MESNTDLYCILQTGRVACEHRQSLANKKETEKERKEMSQNSLCFGW